MPFCLIDGCEGSPINSRGWCNRHYLRWMRHGDPLGGGTFRAPKAERCSVGGCPGEVKTSGLCGKHAWRVRRHGSTDPTRADLETVTQWLTDQMASADRGVCWEWPFRRETCGYGVIGTTRATHLALILAGVRRPVGREWVLHSCDNPPCVNPAHLSWGTPAENTRQAIERGRFDPVEVGKLGAVARWGR